VAADITGTTITNAFTDNDISDNYYGGVYIEYNELYASAYVYDSPASVGGDVAASVAGSAIANTFSGNTINNNGYDDYDSGVSIYNWVGDDRRQCDG
jgi:hypothetical protein